MMKAVCGGVLLAEEIELADRFYTRFKGLMGKKRIGNEEGLLLKKCPSVHCLFMKVPIDVVYLSKEMTVLDVETLRPWSIGKFVKNTAHILELSDGAAQGRTFVGKTIEFIEIGV